MDAQVAVWQNHTLTERLRDSDELREQAWHSVPHFSGNVRDCPKAVNLWPGSSILFHCEDLFPKPSNVAYLGTEYQASDDDAWGMDNQNLESLEYTRTPVVHLIFAYLFPLMVYCLFTWEAAAALVRKTPSAVRPAQARNCCSLEQMMITDLYNSAPYIAFAHASPQNCGTCYSREDAERKKRRSPFLVLQLEEKSSHAQHLHSRRDREKCLQRRKWLRKIGARWLFDYLLRAVRKAMMAIQSSIHSAQRSAVPVWRYMALAHVLARPRKGMH
jgi:hypothetical protein